MLARRVWQSVLALPITAVCLLARPFTVVVYNVENLFDADGVAVYDDYQPDSYRPAHLATKLRNLSDVLARIDAGQGADVILLQEIESDQTPEREEVARVLARYEAQTVAQLLSREPLPRDLAGLPAEAWILKALAERGLEGYTSVTGQEGQQPHEDGHARAITCVTLTRLPVVAVRRYPLRNARNLLEVELELEGARLHVFNTHWKSGAGDPALEEVRLENAQVLRDRIDALLAADPQADIIIGGDFNSHHNQKQRYPAMRRTGINDVLRSQGNELAIRGRQRDLYNLWFELPPEQRGSDTYNGEWGSLMQLMVSRGLYDHRGVQYVDNSFGVATFTHLNVNAAGVPLRWDGGGPAGAGFSDHLPIFARFRTVADNRADRWIALTRPSAVEADSSIRAVRYDAVNPSAVAIPIEDVPAGADLRDGSWSGKLFRVVGDVVPDRHPRVRVRGEEYEIYGPTDAIRQQLRAQGESGRHAFYGELGTFKGRWQFVVRDASWILRP